MEDIERQQIENEMVGAFSTQLDDGIIRLLGPRWAVALQDSRVREPVMFRVLTDTNNLLPKALNWLTALNATTPDATGVASTLAALAWQDGNNELALSAIGKALAADPSNTLSCLVLTAILQDFDPNVWLEVLQKFGLERLRTREELPLQEI